MNFILYICNMLHINDIVVINFENFPYYKYTDIGKGLLNDVFIGIYHIVMILEVDLYLVI